MLKEDLKQFYGTEYYYPITPNVVITDGVKYFANKAQAYWLVTDIAINGMMHDKLKPEKFIVIKTKKANGGINVRYEDGNYNLLLEEDYPLSDLPDDGEYTLWMETNVILLPGEH